LKERIPALEMEFSDFIRIDLPFVGEAFTRGRIGN
jgi:hypothetical protein